MASPHLQTVTAVAYPRHRLRVCMLCGCGWACCCSRWLGGCPWFAASPAGVVFHTIRRLLALCPCGACCVLQLKWLLVHCVLSQLQPVVPEPSESGMRVLQLLVGLPQKQRGMRKCCQPKLVELGVPYVPGKMCTFLVAPDTKQLVWQQRRDLILLHTPRHAAAAAWIVVALNYRQVVPPGTCVLSSMRWRCAQQSEVSC
jgi:hypothetical protein